MHHSGDQHHPSSTNTTFVQADPATFRTIVQRLTGTPNDFSSPKLPLSHPARPVASEIGPRKPIFKLHDRRQTMKRLEIKLNNDDNNSNNIGKNKCPLEYFTQRGFIVSPVSKLDLRSHAGSESAKNVVEEGEEEDKAIAEKGFYLHPSPRGEAQAPELLPLFPLHSPRGRDH